MGRYTTCAVMVGVSVVLAIVLGGLLINRPAYYVCNIDDAVKALTLRTQVISRIAPLLQASAYNAVSAATWKASFHDVGNGSKEAAWTGSVSGTELPVRVIPPTGYRLDDGRIYDILEGFYGWVGSPQSLMTGIALPQRLQEAIDADRIPPSILVFPSLNVDGDRPDCVNIADRPTVGTWTAEEIPHMIQATFSNVTTQRVGWMIMGIFAEAYYATRIAYNVSQRFGAVGVMFSYDLSGEGSLAHNGKALQAQNGLSTVLGKRGSDGMRFYVLGAQDDSSGVVRAAWLVDDAVRRLGSLTVDIPASNGHSWALWNNYFPSLLIWWGSDPVVFKAVGVTTPRDDTWAKVTTVDVKPLSEAPRDQHVVGSASPVRAMPSEINGLGTTTAVVVASLGALGMVTFWSPRWGRRRGGGKQLATQLGDAILGRAVVILVAVELVAIMIRVRTNASGGFYTSWRDLRASVRVNEGTGE